jgi:hypothetical protein
MQLNALIKSKEVLDNIAPLAKTTGEWQAQEAQKTIARLKSEHPDWNEEKVYSEANRVLKPIFEVTQAKTVTPRAPTTPQAQEYAAAMNQAHRELGEGRDPIEYANYAKDILEAQKNYRALPYEVQNVFKAFPEVQNRIKSEPGKISQQEGAKLTSALRVIKSTDEVGKYIQDHPEAVGALAAIENKIRGSMFSLPKISSASPEAQSTIDQEAENRAKIIRSQVGRINIPGVGLMTQGLADSAATLQKMLFQAGLEDAAAMSATGRGGTVYLDQAMSSKVYNQTTNPRTLLEFMRLRSSEAQRNWQLIDPRINFGSSEIPEELHSSLLDPQQYPQMQKTILERTGQISPKKAAPRRAREETTPPGQTFMGYSESGKRVFRDDTTGQNFEE